MANQIHQDSNGQNYINVGTARVTYVKADQRDPEKNWPGQNVIRIQAYRNAKSGSLHPGAEIPMGTAENVIDLIGAICRLVDDGRGCTSQ